MTVVCPMCKKRLEDVAEDFPHRPFCSSRCKLVDLGNWLDERYRISTPASADDVGEPSES